MTEINSERRPVLPRTIRSFSLGIAAVLMFAAGVEAQGLPIGPPPPAPFQTVPPPPGPPGRMAWRPGYWRWNGHAYVWQGGRYLRTPRPYAAWVPGRWVPRYGRWVWVPGHWRY